MLRSDRSLITVKNLSRVTGWTVKDLQFVI